MSDKTDVIATIEFEFPRPGAMAHRSAQLVPPAYNPAAAPAASCCT
jgi:hypothetical protein